MGKTKERKIQFFKLTCNSDTDINEVFRRINDLPKNDTSRYVRKANSKDEHSLFFDYLGDDYTEGQFALRRNENLPSKEKFGIIDPIILDDGQCLYEPSHFVYFPTYKVIGFEYNHFGSRALAFDLYLTQVIDVSPDVINIEPLIDADVLSKFNNTSLITEVEIKIDSLKIPNVNSQTDLEDWLHYTNQTLDMDTICSSFRISKRKGKSVFPIAQIKTYFLKLWREKQHNNFDKLKFKGYNKDGETMLVDMIKDTFCYKTTVGTTDDKHNRIIPADMYKAIRESYGENKPTIEQSAIKFNITE